jgi:predicted lipoprotein with Yx(FWY)xxD motif
MTRNNNLIRYGLGAAAASASVVLLAACSSSGSSAPAASGGSAATTPTTSAAGASASTSGLKTQTTSIGTVTTDASGHTLYELVGDSVANPKCTGGCLSIWPAVMANGTQVVLQGHPAYTFTADTAPGEVKGQGAKDQWGTWYALDSKGAPITTTAPAAPASSSTSSSGGGGGGYGY